MKNSNSRKANALRQLINSYALFMIIGSYFRTCTCKSPITEEMLYLYYRSLDSGRQISTEERIDSYIKSRFGDRLDKLADLNCEAHIYRYGDTYQLVFDTGFEGMVAVVSPDGRYRIFFCESPTLEQAG